jgi:hypothetical protein
LVLTIQELYQLEMNKTIKMRTKYTIFFVSLLILFGCTSQQEKQRQCDVVHKIQLAFEAAQAETLNSEAVHNHNVQFYVDWLSALDRRGYCKCEKY